MWPLTDPLGQRTGRRRNKPPFLNEEEERIAEEKLDSLMSEVIIPLAARTNAIVLTNAFTCNCSLALSFLKMVALQKSKWGKKPPFWVFAMTAEMVRLYQNPNEASEWRKVKQQSRAWRLREPKLYEVLETDTDCKSDRAARSCSPLPPPFFQPFCPPPFPPSVSPPLCPLLSPFPLTPSPSSSLPLRLSFFPLVYPFYSNSNLHSNSNNSPTVAQGSSARFERKFLHHHRR